MPGASPRRFLAAAAAVALAASLAACAPESVAPDPAASATRSVPTSTPTPEPLFDKARYSVDDPDSIWVVTNKARSLDPVDHQPADLVEADVPYVSNPLMRAEAARALKTMFEAASSEGAGELQIQNAYRSYALQVSLHDRLVASLGRARAEAQSARPGHSEHQTGLSVDIVSRPEVCSILECFGETPQGAWLAANAWEYGFILRYPADKAAVTGYIYEPWHFRYVGFELAEQMHLTGISTLEEFFGLPPAPDYVD